MKLKRIRVVLAAISFLAVTALFMDFTGFAAAHWGFLAKIQFLPALLAGGFITAGVILVITLLVGRVYCSVVCPLGIFQDIVFWLRRQVGKKPAFGYLAGFMKVRVLMLVAFIAGGFLGLHFTVLAPYAIYGRAAQAFLAPLARLGNNALAASVTKCGAYAFSAAEVIMPSCAMLVLAGVMIVMIALFAAARGRLWCNVICPVGTVLGLVAKFSRVKIRIEESKCVSCKMCERQCKCQCIDIAHKKVDYSRCVACLDCTAICPKGAVKWN